MSRGRLRRYAISGQVPRPLLRARSAVLRAPLPPRMRLRALAWASYWLAKPELRVLRQFVDPGRVSIDVGANIGVHSYFLGRWSRAVHAYEPNPSLLPALRGSAARNVTVHGVALSDRSGQATLTVPVVDGEAADPYGTLVASTASTASTTTTALHSYSVETRRLDDGGHIDVGLIKIDVEGHEQEVIAGARETIARDRPTLLVEIEQRHLSCDARNFIDEVEGLGYRGWMLLGGALRPAEQFSVERHQTAVLADPSVGPYVENFFFTPRGLA